MRCSEELFRRSMILMGIAEEQADKYLQTPVTSLNDIPAFSEFLITPKKGDAFFCIEDFGSTNLHRVKSIGHKQAVINGLLQSSPGVYVNVLGRKISTSVLKYSCIWIPDDLVNVAYHTLCKCHLLKRCAGLSNEPGNVWWQAFRIASLSEAFKRHERTK